MVPATADLMRPLDAKKDTAGAPVQVRLRHKVTLKNGTELPSRTILVGQVAPDDMRQQGAVKLAIRFTEARLENGTTVPIKATIVGFFGPRSDQSDAYSELGWGGEENPNTWTDATLQVDQIDAASGTDLHSKISSADSGVFVSTKKDDIKLKRDSEIQLAIGPA